MLKKAVIFVILIAAIFTMCACTLLVKSLDGSRNFKEELSQLEIAIRDESWDQAVEKLSAAKKAWIKLKPWLQVDIDHDYVHEIEESLAELKAYIDTEEKPDALANVLLIKETWEDIESY